MYLYIDDLRIPKTDKNWTISRTYDESISIMEKHGCPEYISFDHDLGEEKSGKDIANWIIEMDLNNKSWIPKNFEFNVHSANIIGARNIRELLSNYLSYK